MQLHVETIKKQGVMLNTIQQGDALDILRSLPNALCDMCITSPPFYKLRDYKVDGQIGQEGNIRQYVDKLVEIFDEVSRVIKPVGSLWVDLGDTFNGDKKGNTDLKNKRANLGENELHKIREQGIKNKSLLMIPERFAIAMVDRGWCLRHKVVHYKPNAMPQSAPDRFSLDYDMLYHFVKKDVGYYFQQQYRPLSKSSLKEIEKPFRTIRFGGNKADGYDRRTYSGKPWTPTIPNNGSGPLRGTLGYKNAVKQGWNPQTDYSKWYFDIRSKQGWHDHSNDESEGNMQRGQKPPLLEHPYGAKLRSVWLPDNNDLTVWKISTKPYSGSHYATFAEEYASIPIRATCPPNGIVLDCFMGAGTTALAALRQDRSFVGIELSAKNCEDARNRIKPLLEQRKIFQFGNDI